MLSAVARAEFAPDGIVVSNVYPSVTATEFHQVLRAGDGSNAQRFQAHTAEQVAEVILQAIASGEAEVVVPRAPTV
jgi:short-subunit dehydrogenase